MRNCNDYIDEEFSGSLVWHVQVLAVIFDILVSHQRMAKWHEERIGQHVQDAGRLAEQREQLAQRLASHQQASTSSSPSNAGEAQSPKAAAALAPTICTSQLYNKRWLPTRDRADQVQGTRALSQMVTWHFMPWKMDMSWRAPGAMMCLWRLLLR